MRDEVMILCNLLFDACVNKTEAIHKAVSHAAIWYAFVWSKKGKGRHRIFSGAHDSARSSIGSPRNAK